MSNTNTSDAVLIIKKEHQSALKSVSGNTTTLLNFAKSFEEKDGALFFYWENEPWRGKAIMDLEIFLTQVVPQEDYWYGVINDDLNSDIVCGEWTDNPFDCVIVRGFEWESDDEDASIDAVTLKAKNTSPLSTLCAKCSGQLKDPMPGCHNLKYCPVCEP